MFLLDRPLSERLDEIAAGSKNLRRRIVNEALASFFDRKASNELDLRFAKRLDRISNQLERIERNGRIELESLALFIRYMLAIHAPPPESDEASRAIGRDRFQAFITRVARQLQSGRSTFHSDEPK
jgi:hypothetical protein